MSNSSVVGACSDAGDIFQHSLSSNKAWASYQSHQNPDFFPKLASGQSPQILWLGCSDSRCPETTLLGLQPGDVFVHRNVANIVAAADINTSAVVEYAVVHLRVQHVVLCGHSQCGGAAAALLDGGGGALEVHGCLFDLASGRVRDLGLGNASTAAKADGGRGAPGPQDG